jgi:hypothetical protein
MTLTRNCQPGWLVSIPSPVESQRPPEKTTSVIRAKALRVVKRQPRAHSCDEYRDRAVMARWHDRKQDRRLRLLGIRPAGKHAESFLQIIDPQAPTVRRWRRLTQVIAAWDGLPDAIRKAVVAVIGSQEGIG